MTDRSERFGKRYRFERTAFSERFVSDFFEPLGKCQRRELIALIKGLVADTLHFSGNGNRLQRTAVIKGFFTERFKRLRKIDAFECGAREESTVRNRSDGFGKRNADKAVAVFKGVFADFFKPVAGDGKRSQCVAVSESLVCDFDDTAGNFHGFDL